MAVASASCCAQLATIPGLTVAFPNSTAYTATEQSYWSLQEGSLHPSCIAKPTASKDVAQIISKIVAAGNCQFAIKAQGHAPAAGFANIDAGITIDSTSLNSVNVNADASVASIGAGTKWLDVYTFLDPLNKTVAGGRNGAVGVGGLTIGGGISYFSPQVGWTCDSVVNFEIVLASGELVNANSTSHADLFRALKGGLNNFGVVTRIDFETLPIGEILAGNVVNDIANRQAVFDALANIANAKEYDVHASIVTSLVFNSTSKAWTLLSTPIYTKPVTDPPVYKELFAVPSVANTIHLTQLHTLANESATPQTNILFYTATHGVSAELLDRIFDIANSSFYNFNVSGSLEWLVTFEPLPTVFVSHGAGKDVLGTAPQDGNSMVLLFTGIWSDEADSEKVQAKAAQTIASINDAAREMGLLHEFAYANYANAGQKPVKSYGAGNEAFLKKVAKMYDPHGVFQKMVPGGFKLDD